MFQVAEYDFCHSLNADGSGQIAKSLPLCHSCEQYFSHHPVDQIMACKKWGLAIQQATQTGLRPVNVK